MGFLIDVKFGKVSNIGTMLSKIEERPKFFQLCCRLDELLPTFPPKLRFECLFLNARSNGSSIYENVRGLNKN